MTCLGEVRMKWESVVDPFGSTALRIASYSGVELAVCGDLCDLSDMCDLLRLVDLFGSTALRIASYSGSSWPSSTIVRS